MHPDPSPVRVPHPVGLVERLHVGHAERAVRFEAGQVVGMDQREPERGIVHEPAERIAEDTFDLWAQERDVRARARRAAVRLIDVRHGGDRLDHAAVAAFRVTQPLLGLLASRDVDHESLEVRDRAVVAGHRRRRVVDPDPVAVGVAHPVLLIERDAGAPRLEGGGVHHLAIVGMHQVEPELGVQQEALVRVAEERLDLGTDERHPHRPLGLHIDVGDGGDPLEDAAVAGVRRAQAILLPAPTDRRAQQRGGRPEPVQIGEGPVAIAFAVVEADRAPPLAVNGDREVRDGHDVLRAERGLLRLRERRHGADDGLSGTHALDPAVMVRLPGEAVQGRVEQERTDAGRAPLRGERDADFALDRGVLDQVDPGDAGRQPEALEHLVRGIAPVGGEQQPLGRERRPPPAPRPGAGARHP